MFLSKESRTTGDSSEKNDAILYYSHCVSSLKLRFTLLIFYNSILVVNTYGRYEF